MTLSVFGAYSTRGHTSVRSEELCVRELLSSGSFHTYKLKVLGSLSCLASLKLVGEFGDEHKVYTTPTLNLHWLLFLHISFLIHVPVARQNYIILKTEDVVRKNPCFSRYV